jgi:hypothetical protein
MKLYHKYLVCSLLLVVFSISSCDLEKANVNPNNPVDAPMSALLTSSQVVMSYIIGSDASAYSSIFVQQMSGTGVDFLPYDNYNGAGDRYDLLWSTLYSNSGSDLVKIIEKAEKSNSPHYSGIAKILLAYSVGTLTDLFGDIPYTDAFKGTANLKPTYDSQEKVYTEIQNLLSQAIEELGQSNSSQKPGTDDVIYRGDLNKWTAAAWTLKARYSIHLSKLDATKAATEALNALYSGGINGTYRGIAASNADLQLNFFSSATQAHPLWQLTNLRPGWVALGGNFVNLLNGNGPEMPADPRRPFFATPVAPAPAAPEYRGTIAGKPILPASNIGPFYNSQNSPVPLLTYAEAKFIEAEARLLLNENDPLAEQVLQQAVRASLDKVAGSAVSGAEKDEYMAKRASFGEASSLEEKRSVIITQKYIALFTQPEVWVDYRRTGYPALTPAIGGATGFNPGGGIPRRLPYPISEITYNADNVPAKVQSYESPRLWWDK